MFKHKKTTILLFVFGFVYATSAMATNIPTEGAVAYANFIQNLVNSSSVKKKEGAFCIYGNDAVARSLAKSTAVSVVKQANFESSRHCKAIYISDDNVIRLKSYMKELAANKIMTIGTYEEFVDNGGMIQVGMGRRDFELFVDVRALNSAQIKLDTLSTNLIVN